MDLGTLDLIHMDQVTLVQTHMAPETNLLQTTSDLRILALIHMDQETSPAQTTMDQATLDRTPTDRATLAQTLTDRVTLAQTLTVQETTTLSQEILQQESSLRRLAACSKTRACKRRVLLSVPRRVTTSMDLELDRATQIVMEVGTTTTIIKLID